MKIAVISKWHVHAQEYAEAVKSAPGCELACAWHEDEAEGRAWAQSLGCAFEPDLQKIFDDPEIGGVVITTSTKDHPDVIIRAARAKKAIFTEKVLALSVEDANRIRDAINESGVTFAISYPHKSRPELLFAKKLVEQGALGKIGYARVRNVHDGAVAGWLPDHFYDAQACGGGAMIDLGAHPMYTLAWLLGRPVSVLSMFTSVTGKPVEDNAVSVLAFEGGAIGVSETGFVSKSNPYTLEISGTEGALMVHDGLSYCCAQTDNKWVAPKELPQPQPLPIAQWAEAIQSGRALPEFDIDQAVLLTEIMQAAYQAHKTGQAAKV